MLIPNFNFADAPESYSNIQQMIPEGSRLNAFINSVSLEDTFTDNVAKEGAQYIKVEFEIAAGEAAGFKVVGKFKVEHSDPAKSTDAWRKLSCLDKNCSGVLAKMQAVNPNMEVDDALLKTAFEIGREVQILIAVWETGGKTGNYVAGIGAKGTDHLSGKLFDKPAQTPRQSAAVAAAGSAVSPDSWEL